MASAKSQSETETSFIHVDRRELGGRWGGGRSEVPGTGHRWQLGTFIKCNKTIKNVDANGLKMQHIKQKPKTTKQRNNKIKDKKLKQKVHIKSVKQNKQFGVMGRGVRLGKSREKETTKRRRKTENTRNINSDQCSCNMNGKC